MQFMNDPREQKWMPPELNLQELMKYKLVVREYCALSVKPMLTETEADRMDEILAQAEQEPTLNLLLDEADHLVAHELNLIDPVFIVQQQKKLADVLQRELPKADYSLNKTAEIQAVLKKEGLYTGAIDGVCGPRTEEAIKQLRSRPTYGWLRQLIGLENWSTC